MTIRVEENNFSVNIYIRDNGEGIEKEDIAHIFERFYKGKNALRKQRGYRSGIVAADHGAAKRDN